MQTHQKDKYLGAMPSAKAMDPEMQWGNTQKYLGAMQTARMTIWSRNYMSMDRPYRCPVRLQAAWVAPGLPPAHWACMLLFTLGTRTDFTRTHTHTHEILMQSPVTLPMRKPNLFLMPPS
jgi:hypothetical protein